MRRKVRFELVLEYEHVLGNRRFLKEEELQRITEISGIERTIVPQTGYNAIVVEGYWDQEVIHRILAEVKGPMQRNVHFSQTPPSPGAQAIDVSLSYVYSKQDIEAAPFFQVMAKQSIAETHFEHMFEHGGYPIVKSSIKKCPIGFPGYGQKIACNHELMLAMQSQNFNGLEFDELPRIGESKKEYPRIYNLTSGVKFPPLSCRFTGENYEPLSSYPEEGSCHIQDSCLWQRLTYKHTVIQEMLDIDFAMTMETFGHVTPPEKSEAPDDFVYRRPCLIASQRFKKWCDQNKLKLDWFPVDILYP